MYRALVLGAFFGYPTGMPAFLTARWRHLVMLNYEVDPKLLVDRVPVGTELDFHEQRCWVSVVGFMFLDTVVVGVPIPWHRDFEELNLRFYVRRTQADERRGVPYRRGVVFIKELVPRWAIATVARWVYNEPYASVPMRHAVRRIKPGLEEGAPLHLGDMVSYGFEIREDWGEARARVAGAPAATGAGSHANFITEHYWGYTRRRDGKTDEYEVTHPSWEVHDADSASLSGDLRALYGPEFAAVLARPPDSALIAVGSEVSVLGGRKLS